MPTTQNKAPLAQKTYPVYLTQQELLEIEDLLFEKSSRLEIISNKLKSSKRTEESRVASIKGIYFEKLAGKVGAPLDAIYAQKGTD